MTVAELIKELQQHDPSMRVVDYSIYGYSDVKKVIEVRIALNVSDPYDNDGNASHAEVAGPKDYPRHVHVNAVAII